MTNTIPLTIAHSPDPDDAFMWWPLGTPDSPPHIDITPFSFTPVPEDIQALNERAINHADLDITALSYHAFAHCHHNYTLTSCGSSMGDNYGPRLVANQPHTPDWLTTPNLRFAVPGLQTSAYLTLRILLNQPINAIPMRFDQIPNAVRNNDADVGLVIHQSQITYQEEQLHLIADLGKLWHERTQLPLPLGANAVRSDLDQRFGQGTTTRLAAVLHNSIQHALANRERSLDAAAVFEPDLPRDISDRFVAMYVNQLTLDAGSHGRQAIRTFLDTAAKSDLIPPVGTIQMASPTGFQTL